MSTTKIRPGLLVRCSVVVRGGVQYARTDLEPDHEDAQGARVARWETLRRIDDPAEFADAEVARSTARARIARECISAGDFGLLCLKDKRADLDRAIEEARAIADAFNGTARRCRVDVYTITGEILDNDVEAARAIGGEVRALVERMQIGIASADPEQIRKAASRARAIGGMLDESAQGRVTAAIEEARKAASAIARRLADAGDVATVVVSDLKTEALEAARFAFLDLDAPAAAAAPEPKPAPAALDLFANVAPAEPEEPNAPPGALDLAAMEG